MAEAGTHIFRVALRDRPSVHRDLEIDSGQSLAKLAEAIVRALSADMESPPLATRNRPPLGRGKGDWDGRGWGG